MPGPAATAARAGWEGQASARPPGCFGEGRCRIGAVGLRQSSGALAGETIVSVTRASVSRVFLFYLSWIYGAALGFVFNCIRERFECSASLSPASVDGQIYRTSVKSFSNALVCVCMCFPARCFEFRPHVSTDSHADDYKETLNFHVGF